jgi:hypothetical protein
MDCFAPVAGAESTEQTPVLFSETGIALYTYFAFEASPAE